MDSYKKPSQWCEEKQSEALERGDTETALHYFEMFKLWESRGL